MNKGRVFYTASLFRFSRGILGSGEAHSDVGRLPRDCLSQLRRLWNESRRGKVVSDRQPGLECISNFSEMLPETWKGERVFSCG